MRVEAVGAQRSYYAAWFPSIEEGALPGGVGGIESARPRMGSLREDIGEKPEAQEDRGGCFDEAIGGEDVACGPGGPEESGINRQE